MQKYYNSTTKVGVLVKNKKQKQNKTKQKKNHLDQSGIHYSWDQGPRKGPPEVNLSRNM